MPSVKLVRTHPHGHFVPIYPECPYAGEEIPLGEFSSHWCKHPDREFDLCCTNHMPNDKEGNISCMFGK